VHARRGWPRADHRGWRHSLLRRHCQSDRGRRVKRHDGVAARGHRGESGRELPAGRPPPFSPSSSSARNCAS
jgi:hypothetical protein